MRTDIVHLPAARQRELEAAARGMRDHDPFVSRSLCCCPGCRGRRQVDNAACCVAQAEGHALTGLAFQNKMIGDLAEGAGIKAQTIASFLLANERFIVEQGTERHKAARDEFAGTMLIVDEASMGWLGAGWLAGWQDISGCNRRGNPNQNSSQSRGPKPSRRPRRLHPDIS